VLTLRELAGESGDIEDPAARDENFFRHTRDEINRCLELGLERLVADVTPPR
jgi:protein-tyrosine-phosphatase